MTTHGSARERDQQASDAAYDRWAPVYDLVFNWPFQPGRRAATEAAARVAGGRILVVGVGTGLELPLLPRSARVTGVDLSRPMLDVARRRVQREKLAHVERLAQMDAQALAFPDAAFDVALAPFVLSVVPDPAKALDEMWRVVRPGGELVAVNHFASEGGAMAAIERGIEGASAWLGWKPRFPYAAVGDWLAAHPEARLLERRVSPPLALFTLLRIARV